LGIENCDDLGKQVNHVGMRLTIESLKTVEVIRHDCSHKL
jgi:hypothetical protein